MAKGKKFETTPGLMISVDEVAVGLFAQFLSECGKDSIEVSAGCGSSEYEVLNPMLVRSQFVDWVTENIGTMLMVVNDDLEVV